jgi:hypothetical protein
MSLNWLGIKAQVCCGVAKFNLVLAMLGNQGLFLIME